MFEATSVVVGAGAGPQPVLAQLGAPLRRPVHVFQLVFAVGKLALFAVRARARLLERRAHLCLVQLGVDVGLSSGLLLGHGVGGSRRHGSHLRHHALHVHPVGKRLLHGHGVGHAVGGMPLAWCTLGCIMGPPM